MNTLPFPNLSLDSKCPLCATESRPFRVVDEVSYFECASCEFLFADQRLLDKADSGAALRVYDSSYWEMELASARDRAFGSSLARVAEVILYARRPISRFIDICSGPGYLLDALQLHLPHATERFFGVELYPPPQKFCSTHHNFSAGDLASLPARFQAGVCIEVLEHLTPQMARKLASDLARISDPEALYIFNTGLVSYVKNEDPSYLDPFQRGHITVWSVSAARRIFEPAGFSVIPIAGKTWAFAVEFQGKDSDPEHLLNRIWTPLPENKALLTDPTTGSVMYILGLESARAYT
jgi:hypothetical protein